MPDWRGRKSTRFKKGIIVSSAAGQMATSGNSAFAGYISENWLQEEKSRESRNHLGNFMDSISDFFIRIKNAYLVKKDRVVIPFSKMKYEMAKILEQKDFILAVRKKKKTKEKGYEQLFLDLKLKYDNGAAHSTTLN